MPEPNRVLIFLSLTLLSACSAPVVPTPTLVILPPAATADLTTDSPPSELPASPTPDTPPLSTCAPMRHFSVDGVEDPFSLVPDWFDEQIEEQVEVSCDGFSQCLAAYRRVPLASHQGAIIASLRADYIPEDLVLLKDANIVNSLDVFQEMRAAAVGMLSPFFRELEQLGYIPLVRSFYRSYEKQDEVIENEPGAAAPAGYSMHQSGLAFDLWNATPDFELGEPLYSTEIVAMAERYGIVHPYDWDRPHYFALDVVWPGATAMLRDAGLDPHDNDTINGFLLGLLRRYEGELAALSPEQCRP